ncbi:unnamed protein product [Caenorhabditis auriculariae]|uniref:MADF domain-containing protein n=1 Tax=Caenorhabditis auriculariae TaxID=2777116 RepID=A0A8S1H4M9_9PELO|nr:unnamed protein product [Caenorhabditis auriculariae]
MSTSTSNEQPPNEQPSNVSFGADSTESGSRSNSTSPEQKESPKDAFARFLTQQGFSKDFSEYMINYAVLHQDWKKQGATENQGPSQQIVSIEEIESDDEKEKEPSPTPKRSIRARKPKLLPPEETPTLSRKRGQQEKKDADKEDMPHLEEEPKQEVVSDDEDTPEPKKTKRSALYEELLDGSVGVASRRSPRKKRDVLDESMDSDEADKNIRRSNRGRRPKVHFSPDLSRVKTEPESPEESPEKELSPVMSQTKKRGRKLVAKDLTLRDAEPKAKNTPVGKAKNMKVKRETVESDPEIEESDEEEEYEEEETSSESEIDDDDEEEYCPTPKKKKFGPRSRLFGVKSEPRPNVKKSCEPRKSLGNLKVKQEIKAEVKSEFYAYGTTTASFYGPEYDEKDMLERVAKGELPETAAYKRTNNSIYLPAIDADMIEGNGTDAVVRVNSANDFKFTRVCPKTKEDHADKAIVRQIIQHVQQYPVIWDQRLKCHLQIKYTRRAWSRIQGALQNEQYPLQRLKQIWKNKKDYYISATRAGTCTSKWLFTEDMEFYRPCINYRLHHTLTSADSTDSGISDKFALSNKIFACEEDEKDEALIFSLRMLKEHENEERYGDFNAKVTEIFKNQLEKFMKAKKK